MMMFINMLIAENITNLNAPRFEGFDQDTIYWFENFTTNLVDFHHGFVNLQYHIAVFGIIVNLAHFVVLTRKSMMNNSVNLILAVLAINDVIILGLLISDQYNDMNYGSNDICEPIYFLEYQILHLVQETIRNLCRRNSSWLAILMAGVRTLTVTNVENPSFSSLTTIQFGAKAILLEFLLCSMVSLSVPFPLLFKDWTNKKYEFEWYQGDDCEGYPHYENRTERYLNRNDDDKARIIVIDTVTTNVIPSSIYPILTFFLIRALFRVKKNRKRLGQEQGSDRSTFVVIGMTISFMIAEIPQSIGYFVEVFETRPGLSYIGEKFRQIFANVSYLNICTHCFICFSLSSVYRNAVFDLLPIKRKPSPGPVKGVEGVVSTQMGTHVET